MRKLTNTETSETASTTQVTNLFSKYTSSMATKTSELQL